LIVYPTEMASCVFLPPPPSMFTVGGGY
jgi:hypothetical protein